MPNLGACLSNEFPIKGKERNSKEKRWRDLLNLELGCGGGEKR